MMRVMMPKAILRSESAFLVLGILDLLSVFLGGIWKSARIKRTLFPPDILIQF